MAKLRSESFLRYYHKAKDNCAHWKELGVLLSMEMSALELIEVNYPRDAITCMIEMLHVWLKSNPENPEAKLNEALRKLKTKLSHGHEFDFVEVDSKMEKNIKQLKSDFSMIVVSACSWLRNHFPEAEDATVWLNEILKVHQQDPPVVQGVVRDHPALREQLQAKWSFVNPDILQRLVNEIGTNEVELLENMTKYKEKFKKVCAMIPISKEVESESCDHTKPCLILKITEVSDFPDIEVFLTEVFGIYKRYLRIHKIQQDCVGIDKNCEAAKHAEMHYAVKSGIFTTSETVLPQQGKLISKSTQTKKQEMHKSMHTEISKKISEVYQQYKEYGSQLTGTKEHGPRFPGINVTMHTQEN